MINRKTTQYRVLIVVESQDADQERIDTHEVYVDCTESQALALAAVVARREWEAP